LSDAVRLVVFDCDGVLVDSETISNGVLARMLSAQGLPTTLAQARRDYQGLLLQEVASEAEARLGRRLPDGWLEEYERVRAEEFRASLEPVAGAAATVERVRAAGVMACVASQGKLEKTLLSLELTGLLGLFADGALFSAHALSRGKPHPDLFLHAAQAMGVEPSACVVVEDTPSGVMAGVAAGMRVLGFALDSDAEALAHAGAEVVSSHGEVPAMLGL
jgi:HAD superfamily hydrolase (TIGR01509 family)